MKQEREEKANNHQLKKSFKRALFKLFFSLTLLAPPFYEEALYGAHPWSDEYDTLLQKEAYSSVIKLNDYPILKAPNQDAKKLIELYPNRKVPIFSYGSLINKESASRTVSPEAIATMQPVVAFGLKRIFNYKASKTSQWGEEQNEREKAMLNVAYTNDYDREVNGVVIEVEGEDLEKLVSREKGYDLVPVLVADWQGVIDENPKVDIKVAYTFLSPFEKRLGAFYTSYCYYPVRGYLEAVQEAVSEYGEEFYNFWNGTTYLGDGITPVADWDKQNFSSSCEPE